MSVVIENLIKTYGKQNAVDNISFSVNTGEIVGFLGPNGAGKSTTMKIATGYLPPTQGTIKVCGYEVSQNSMEVRRNIGYLPEHNPLYLDMYVREYLSFIGQLHKIKGKNLKTKVQELIEICGLSREQGKKIASLSKGYRQRVGLAQALIHNPPVLILDEPTTGLDPNQIVEIRNLIKNIGKEKTVIISTHNMPEVEVVCDRAVIINLGKIVADSPVTELKTLTKKENIISVEFEKAIDEKILANLEGVKKVEKIGETRYQIHSNTEIDVRGKIFKLASEQNWTLLGLQQQESSLESVFQNLTQI